MSGYIIKNCIKINVYHNYTVDKIAELLTLKDPDQPPPALGEVCYQERDNSFTDFVFQLYAQFRRGIPALNQSANTLLDNIVKMEEKVQNLAT